MFFVWGCGGWFCCVVVFARFFGAFVASFVFFAKDAFSLFTDDSIPVSQEDTASSGECVEAVSIGDAAEFTATEELHMFFDFAAQPDRLSSICAPEEVLVLDAALVHFVFELVQSFFVL